MKPYESPRSTYSGRDVSRTFNFGFVLGVICAVLFALVLLGTLSGCAAVEVRIAKPDGTVVTASGISVLKDHGLEGLNYERSAEATKFNMSGYSSQQKLEAVLRAIAEAVK